MTGSPYKVAQDVFGDVMEGSLDKIVDPEECIRMKGTRKLYQSGIIRFYNSFRGTRGASSNGYSSAGGIPVVASIPEDFLHYVTEFFVMELGMSSEEAEAKMKSRSKWFMVVVGAYRHAALILLGQREPQKWAGYGWRVRVVSWKPVQLLRAFSRHSNELNGKEHHVELTFYDTISALKDVSNEILRERGEVNNSSRSNRLLNAILDRYSAGRNTITDSTRQIAAVALKLNQTVIDCMGEIVNEENAKLANARAKNKRRTAKSCPDVRVFRKIFNSSTFKKTPTFFSVATDEDRKNVLLRLRYRAASTENFKGVLPEEVEDQTKRCMGARMEAEKFELVYGSSTWPARMTGLHKNLLETTKMDEVVENNVGNDKTLLQPVADLYRRISGEEAAERMERFSRGTLDGSDGEEADEEAGIPESEETQGQDESTSNNGSVVEISEDGQSIPEAAETGTPNLANVTSDVSQASATATDVITAPSAPDEPASSDASHCPLSALGVQCFEYTWEAYEVNEVTETQVFDQIICEPAPPLPDGVKPVLMDETQKKRFAEFSRRMLVPGGCIILITSLDEYREWTNALKIIQMRVMKDAIYLIKDTSRVQANNSPDPQSVVEIAVVAWAPGRRPNFRNDLTTGYEYVEGCSHKRKYNVIDKIPPPDNRLTFAPRKKLVRPNEKTPLLFTELLQTFCPPGGCVFDPFANAFTTGISSIASQRTCVLLESDSKCFELAKARLKNIASQQIESGPSEKRRRIESSVTAPVTLEASKTTVVPSP